MTPTREEVERVAMLARLLLSEEELDRMTSHLGKILEYVEQLSQLDTENVEPMAHALDLTNVFRPDQPQPSLSREGGLANAPQTDGEFFLVPAVLG